MVAIYWCVWDGFVSAPDPRGQNLRTNHHTSLYWTKAMAKTPSSRKWTSQTNEELLIHIIQLYVPKIDYEEVAAKMGGVTPKAVKCQYLKLKGPGRGKPTGGEKSVKRGLDKTEEAEEDVKPKKMKTEM
jgi:hypothetical protein